MSPEEVVIRAGHGRISSALGEAWRYRELLYLLVWRDIKVRYKQTALGATWAVLQPVATMVVFSLVFGLLARMPSDGSPYPVFVLAGLVPWQLFAQALTGAAGSLLANERLVTRVYLPRLLLPLSSVFAGLMDFAVALVVLLIFASAYGIRTSWRLSLLPVFAFLTMAAAAAVGIGLAALNARFRDVRHALPFLTQLWMFSTPLAYPGSLVPPQYRPLCGLNPMWGVVDGFRWALLGTTVFPSATVAVSCGVIAVGLCLSLVYFTRVERTLADVM